MDDYYTWHDEQLMIGDQVIRYATKPGLADTLLPLRLLAEAVEAQPGERALDLTCGSGLASAALMQRGVDVTSFDDGIVAVEAARRTLTLNGFPAESVQVGDAYGEGFDLALIAAPKGREVGRRLLAQAARCVKPVGRIYLAGATRSGIKSLIADARDLLGPMAVVRVKASHRVAVGQVGADVGPSIETDYTSHVADVRGRAWPYMARPGVFAWDRLDEGSRCLIETMQIDRSDAVLDLGCGCGLVGLVASTLAQHVISVDASAAAVEATRRTYQLNHVTNAEVRLSDCASAVFDMRFDAVVTNPPFHQGVGTDYAVARQFARDAAQLLYKPDAATDQPGGRLWLVANRFLRYEHELVDRFAKVQVAYEDNRYRVLVAEVIR